MEIKRIGAQRHNRRLVSKNHEGNPVSSYKKLSAFVAETPLRRLLLAFVTILRIADSFSAGLFAVAKGLISATGLPFFVKTTCSPARAAFIRADNLTLASLIPTSIIFLFYTGYHYSSYG